MNDVIALFSFSTRKGISPDAAAQAGEACIAGIPAATYPREHYEPVRALKFFSTRRENSYGA